MRQLGLMNFNEILLKLVIVVLLLVSNFVFSQDGIQNKVKYTPSFRFKEGLYVSHGNLLNNKPIPKSKIISNLDKSSFDFFYKLLKLNTIKYIDEYGIKSEIKVEQLWGFCQKGAVFVNWGDDFNRITIVGSLCHFVANFTYQDDFSPTPYDYYTYNYYGSNYNTSVRTERSQYILNFKTGKIVDYNCKNIAEAIKDDKQLYDEFVSLRRKKQKKRGRTEGGKEDTVVDVCVYPRKYFWLKMPK